MVQYFQEFESSAYKVEGCGFDLAGSSLKANDENHMTVPMQNIVEDIRYWFSQTAKHLLFRNPETLAEKCFDKAKTYLSCLTSEEQEKFLYLLPRVPWAGEDVWDMHSLSRNFSYWKDLNREQLTWLYENLWGKEIEKLDMWAQNG